MSAAAANRPSNGAANGSANGAANEIKKTNSNARIFHGLYGENHEMIRLLTHRIGEMNYIIQSLVAHYMKAFNRAGIQPSAQSALEELSTENEDTNEESLSEKNLEWTRRIQTKSHLRLPLHPAHRPKMVSPSLTFEYYESFTLFLASVKKFKRKYKKALKVSTDLEESLNEYRNKPESFSSEFLKEKMDTYNNVYAHINSSGRMYVDIKDTYPRWIDTIATTKPLSLPVISYKNTSNEARAARMATRKAYRSSLREGRQALREERGLPLSTSLKKGNEKEGVQRAAQRVRSDLKHVHARFGKGDKVRLIPTREEIKAEEQKQMEINRLEALSASSGGTRRERALRKKRTLRTLRKKRAHRKRTHRNRA